MEIYQIYGQKNIKKWSKNGHFLGGSNARKMLVKGGGPKSVSQPLAKTPCLFWGGGVVQGGGG